MARGPAEVKPDLAIERTSSGKLHLPAAIAHGER